MKRQITILLLVLIVLPSTSIVWTVGDEGSRDWTNGGLYVEWSERRIMVMNYENVTAELKIEYRGAPLNVNVTIICSKIFYCPVKGFNNMTITHNTPKFLNITFIPRAPHPDLLQGIDVVAIVYNDTYSIKSDDRIQIRVSPHISVDFLPPMKLNERHFGWKSYKQIENGTVFTNEWQGNYWQSMCPEVGTEINFNVSNLDNTEPFKAYFMIIRRYSVREEEIGRPGHYKLKEVSDRIVTENEIEISPSSNVTINLKIPPISEYSGELRMELDYAVTSDSTNPSTAYALRFREGKLAYAFQLTASVNNVCGLSIQMDHVYDERLALGTGTDFIIKLSNYRREPVNDATLYVVDIVTPISSFYYLDYWNRTEVWKGDLGSYEEIIMNTTSYSKISGAHFFYAYLDKYDAEFSSEDTYYNNYDFIAVNIPSGLNLTYLDEKTRQFTCREYSTTVRCTQLAKIETVNINDEVDIFLKVNETADPKGELGLSVLIEEPVGKSSWVLNEYMEEVFDERQEMNYAYVHGNGWLDLEELVEIEPKSIQLDGRDVYRFTLRPKTLGNVIIVPYLETTQGILLFDENMGLQYFEECSAPYGYQREVMKCIYVRHKGTDVDVFLHSSISTLIMMNVILGSVFFMRRRGAPIRKERTK